MSTADSKVLRRLAFTNLREGCDVCRTRKLPEDGDSVTLCMRHPAIWDRLYRAFVNCQPVNLKALNEEIAKEAAMILQPLADLALVAELAEKTTDDRLAKARFSYLKEQLMGHAVEEQRATRERLRSSNPAAGPTGSAGARAATG